MSILPNPCPQSTALSQQLLFPDGSPDLEIESDVERWLPIPDWPGYEISDCGRLRSYRGSGWKPGKDRKVPIPVGGYPSMRKGRIVNLQVCLYRTDADGTRHKWRNGIHIVVLTMFRGPCPPGMEGCHGDSDPTNNHLHNLRWDTPANNKLDLLMREDSQFKLSNEDVRAIWPRLLSGEPDYLIAKDYGVTSGTILGIKMGDTWTHVTGDLPGFPLMTEARVAAGREPVYIPKEFADSPVEIWRPIPGYPQYRVSTFGNVESCRKRAMFKEPGEPILESDWRPMSPGVGKYGHMRFLVRNSPTERFAISVHVAVLLAFAGPCPPGMIGCHADDNPQNNHASNLRWDSHRANKLDALRNASLKAEKSLAEAYPDQFPRPPG